MFIEGKRSGGRSSDGDYTMEGERREARMMKGSFLMVEMSVTQLERTLGHSRVRFGCKTGCQRAGWGDSRRCKDPFAATKVSGGFLRKCCDRWEHEVGSVEILGVIRCWMEDLHFVIGGLELLYKGFLI
eukprot:c14135_g2_i1 orf=116-502(+)